MITCKKKHVLLCCTRVELTYLLELTRLRNELHMWDWILD